MTEKVKLPKEVADSIEICREAGLSNIDIVTGMDNVHWLFRDYNKPVFGALTKINNFAGRIIGGGQDLLEGLVNGYEVEQTPVDKIREDFETANALGQHEYKQGILSTLQNLGIKIQGVND